MHKRLLFNDHKRLARDDARYAITSLVSVSGISKRSTEPTWKREYNGPWSLEGPVDVTGPLFLTGSFCFTFSRHSFIPRLALYTRRRITVFKRLVLFPHVRVNTIVSFSPFPGVYFLLVSLQTVNSQRMVENELSGARVHRRNSRGALFRGHLTEEFQERARQCTREHLTEECE